jgi:P-type E1-E2 ATPase
MVVKYLQKEMGMKVYMITGDNKHSALRVAKHVGIHPDNVTYEAYPETKRNIVESLQK